LVLCARDLTRARVPNRGKAETGLPGVASDRHRQGELPTTESTWVLFKARALRGRATTRRLLRKAPEMDLDRFECGRAFQSLVRAAGDRKVLEVR